MKKYRYYPDFDENDCLVWHVFENATKQIIESFLFEEDAIHEAMRLDNGGAFDGFTPPFILRKTSFANINDAFEAEFYE